MFSGTGLALGFWIGYLFAIAWGSYRLSTGFISFGTLTAFLQLVGQVQSPFHGMARIFPKIYSTIASAGRIISIEEMPDESGDGLSEMPANDDISDIFIDDVSFSYDDDNVLRKASINLKRGEMAIIAGPSGEGKTTLFRILLGLIKPIAGSAVLSYKNGVSIELSPKTRCFFSYVPQGNFVISGSIKDNLCFGKPDATLDEMIDCTKAACIYDFIIEQPGQFDALIGEKGIGLSEGQAQRIAIARALMRNAPILLLDEATSALDEVTEAKILTNLRENSRKKICLFVSHRESINSICDKYFFLTDGILKEAAEPSYPR